MTGSQVLSLLFDLVLNLSEVGFGACVAGLLQPRHRLELSPNVGMPNVEVVFGVVGASLGRRLALVSHLLRGQGRLAVGVFGN